MLKYCIFGQVEPPQDGAYVLLTGSHHSWISLYFMVQTVPGASCTFPASVLEPAISQGALVPWNREWYLGAKIWVLDVIILLGFY